MPQLPPVSSESAAGETSGGAATKTAEPQASDILSERLRQRRRLESDAGRSQAGSMVPDATPRGIPRKSTRDPLGLGSQFSRPQADDEAAGNRPAFNPDQPYDTPKGQPFNRSKSRSMSQDGQDVAGQPRGAEGMRGESARGPNSSRGNESAGPAAPGRPRGGRLSDLPRLPSPVQSPFPQLPPRPTGFVEEQIQSPFRPQPRQTFNNPYAIPTINNRSPIPTVHPPGAYHEDYNP